MRPQRLPLPVLTTTARRSGAGVGAVASSAPTPVAASAAALARRAPAPRPPLQPPRGEPQPWRGRSCCAAEGELCRAHAQPRSRIGARLCATRVHRAQVTAASETVLHVLHRSYVQRSVVDMIDSEQHCTMSDHTLRIVLLASTTCEPLVVHPSPFPSLKDVCRSFDLRRLRILPLPATIA